MDYRVLSLICEEKLANHMTCVNRTFSTPRVLSTRENVQVYQHSVSRRYFLEYRECAESCVNRNV